MINETLDYVVHHHKHDRQDRRYFYIHRRTRTPQIVDTVYSKDKVEEDYESRMQVLGLGQDDFELAHLNLPRVADALKSINPEDSKRAYHKASMNLLAALGIAQPRQLVGRPARPEQMDSYIKLAMMLVKKGKV